MIGRFIEWVVSKLGFHPPRPSTYGYIHNEDGQFTFDDLWTAQESGVTLDLHKLHTAEGEEIPALHYKHTQSDGVTLLFSHGNAVDLGLLREHFLALVCMLKVDLFAYDYSGFGIAAGKPTETKLYKDIECAYLNLTLKLNVPPRKVVLYGQSIGTAPTVDLASRTQGLRGVILHSPFLSGMRVFCPGLLCSPLDAFSNCDKVHDISCPVLIMHGAQDQVVHVTHAQRLHRQLSRASVMPLFIHDAGHNNLECYPEFCVRLGEFLRHLWFQQKGPLRCRTEVELHDFDPLTPNSSSGLWLNSISSFFARVQHIKEREAPSLMASTRREVSVQN